MTGVLPPEIQWRTTKANLAPNFHRRFRDIDLVGKTQDDTAAGSPYLRAGRLRELRAAYDAASAGEKRMLALILFRVMMLQTWLQQVPKHENSVRSEAEALSPVAA
jgi:hypothetical protein